MIFSSLKEKEELYAMVEKQDAPDDLSLDQRCEILGMYDAMDELDRVLVDYIEEDSSSILERIEREIAEETIKSCKERIKLSVMEMIVSFREDNGWE